MLAEREVLPIKVEIKISEDIPEPNVVIYTKEITEEITQVAAAIRNATGKVITALENGRIIVLRSEEIYMVRVENEKTAVYGKTQSYNCSKRLYEIEEIMGKDFMRISKSVLINLKYLDCVEPSFNGMMLLKLKNGSKDYVSRKYLPVLKNYLGI